MDSQKRTGKRSGEVVENTFLWKKRTGTNRKTNRAMLLKINDRLKSSIGYRIGPSACLEGLASCCSVRSVMRCAQASDSTRPDFFTGEMPLSKIKVNRSDVLFKLIFRGCRG